MTTGACLWGPVESQGSFIGEKACRAHGSHWPAQTITCPKGIPGPDVDPRRDAVALSIHEAVCAQGKCKKGTDWGSVADAVLATAVSREPVGGDGIEAVLAAVDTTGLAAALCSDPEAVVTEAQVRAVTEFHTRHVAAALRASAPEDGLRAAVEALAAKWDQDRMGYPGTHDGYVVETAVRLCTQELRALLADQPPTPALLGDLLDRDALDRVVQPPTPDETAAVPVDVYPVGVLSSLHRIRRALDRSVDLDGKRLNLIRYSLRVERRYLLGQARKGNWRAVKNSFNGYLAEHQGCAHDCGSGWTKRAARRRADALCRRHITHALESL